MDFQWIFLALFLVAIISGVSKTLKRSMLRNCLRLASVVFSFLLTFILQICGVFQSSISSVLEALDLAAEIPALAGVMDFVIAMASTLVSPIFFIIVFFVILLVCRIVVHFVVNAIESKQSVAEPAPEPAAEITAETPAEAEPSEQAAAVEAESSEQAAAVEAEPVATEPAPMEEPKKKKSFFYDECAWKRAISIASGVVSGIFILAVLLMPTFYLDSILDTVTDATAGSDAEDSVVYQLVEVIDEDIASPLGDNFVFGFYRVTGMSPLMNYTVKAGGRMVLDSGDKTYADDVLKNLLSNAVSLAAQVTSKESEHATLKENLLAIIEDSFISSALSDLVTDIVATIEMEKPSDEDMIGGLIYGFLDYYKTADKAIIEQDIKALGGAVGALAESGIVTDIITGGGELGQILEDEDTLGDVVEAVSGLSAFGQTMQGAFELGVGMLGEMLYIPADSAEVYDNFMVDLCSAMQISGGAKYTKFASSEITKIYKYINYCVTSNGGKLYSSADKDLFLAYVAQWQKIQSTFSYISEDKSYGYFSIQINGQTYVYDHQEKAIVILSDANSASYKNKISPVAGLINYLTAKSSTKSFSSADILGYFEKYSQNDPASLALAKKLLDKDSYVTSAATIDGMVASIDFINWDAEARAEDGRLCAGIIVKLVGLIDSLGSADMSAGTESIESLLGDFATLGGVLDDMNATSCINGLPSLVIEGLIKSDMLDDFMKPSMAYQMTDLVKNQGKTYAACMTQIVDVIKFALGNLEVNK